MMKSWVCRNTSGIMEIMRTQLRPSNAVCESPWRPDGRPADKMDLVVLKWGYDIPGTETRVEIAENDTPPAFYRNPVTRQWITPVPDPVPRFWFSDGQWFVEETDGAESHPAARIVPSVYGFAEIDLAAYESIRQAEIASVRQLHARRLRREYEAAVYAVLSQYPQAERDAWPQKEAEAKEWASLSASAKTTAITDMAYPLIIGEALQGDYSGTASAKKAKVDAVAARVVANGLAYRTFSGECTGILKKALAEVQAVSGSLAEVEAALSAIEPAWPSLGG